MSAFYPTLDAQTIRYLEVVKSLHSEDPAYLRDSPYSDDVITALTEVFKPTIVPVATFHSPSAARTEPVEEIDPETGKPVEVMMFEGLREEIKQAYLHLKKAKNDKNQDKVAWAKNAVNLLEKLVKLDAQSANIEMVGNFQREILSFLEEECTEKQRENLLKRIETFLTPSADVAAVLADIEDESSDEQE